MEHFHQILLLKEEKIMVVQLKEPIKEKPIKEKPIEEKPIKEKPIEERHIVVYIKIIFTLTNCIYYLFKKFMVDLLP